MQTERVTFLTTPDHKAALDAFATAQGMSVGHVVREATSRYLAEPDTETTAEDALLNLALDELEKELPKWNARMESMERSIEAARRSIRESLAAVEAKT